MHNLFLVLFVFGATAPQLARASSFTRFLDHTQRRTTVGRTPLDEWSTGCRDLYLKTHKTHDRQTLMPPVGFEPTISAGEQPQTYALDLAATGTGLLFLVYLSISMFRATMGLVDDCLVCRAHPAYQSSTQNNKYPVLQKRSCFSWWWAHSRTKHVEIDKYTKNNLCTKLVLFTRFTTVTCVRSIFGSL